MVPSSCTPQLGHLNNKELLMRKELLIRGESDISVFVIRIASFINSLGRLLQRQGFFSRAHIIFVNILYSVVQFKESCLMGSHNFTIKTSQDETKMSRLGYLALCIFLYKTFHFIKGPFRFFDILKKKRFSALRFFRIFTQKQPIGNSPIFELQSKAVLFIPSYALRRYLIMPVYVDKVYIFFT